MIRRRLLTLSASAALHLAGLGLALVIAGAGASSAILIDLVADVEGDAVNETRALSPTGSGSGETEPARTTPVRQRLTASPARHTLSSMLMAVQGGSVVSGSAPDPSSRAAGETRPKGEREPETGSAVAPLPRVPDPATPAAAPEGQATTSSVSSEAATPRGERAGAAGVGSGAVAGLSGGERTSPGLAGSAAGSTASSAGPGTSGEGRGGIPPEYGPYLKRFRRRLQESLEYPLAARRQGLSGSVELEILLEPSGRIGAVRVISSSSHTVLDDAALDAVRRLAPEPLPAPLPRRPLRIRLPLGFELK
jgi:periplasmic protein TonB